MMTQWFCQASLPR